MSSLKPVYLFAGGRPRNAQTLNPLFHAVFRESGKTSPAIAYVGAAERTLRRKKLLEQKRTRSLQREAAEWVVETLRPGIQAMVSRSRSYKDPYLLSRQIIRKLGLKSARRKK